MFTDDKRNVQDIFAHFANTFIIKRRNFVKVRCIIRKDKINIYVHTFIVQWILPLFFALSLSLSLSLSRSRKHSSISVRNKVCKGIFSLCFKKELMYGFRKMYLRLLYHLARISFTKYMLHITRF